MEKTIYKLELHEDLWLKDKKLVITRVASGWLYKYYKEVYLKHHDTYRNDFTQIVFVPYDNNFQTMTG